MSKRRVDGGDSSPSISIVVPGASLDAGFYMAANPTRWIVVVQDDGGTLHPVFVRPDTWESREVGDLITAQDPLVDVR